MALAVASPVSLISESVVDKTRTKSNWLTLESQPMETQSLQDLFENRIPTIEVPEFLSTEECQRLMDVATTHEKGWYLGIDPPVGRIGITQFEHQENKDLYFSQTKEATQLQERFLKEANIDVIGRACETIRKFTLLPVRIAKEGDKDYFAGLVRVITGSKGLIHADYGPFDGPEWEIGKISAQITWNILLKQVCGGAAVVYDRPWQGESDKVAFKNPTNYGYSEEAVKGRSRKVMSYTEGHLTMFNSRNFHEVQPLDKPKEEVRYTISSFVGLLPETAPNGPAIILWS